MQKLLHIGYLTGRSVQRDPVGWLIGLAALVLLFLLGWRAVSLVDNYDGASFNLPYAARVAGICASDCLQLIPWLENRFDHIPKFGHYLFAGVWLLTGSASATGLVNFLSLVLLIVYLALVFRVHWGLTALALIAVPFVRIPAVNFSPDLLPNVLVVLGVFTVLAYVLHPKAFSRWHAVFGLLAVAAASATKLQVYPVAILAIGLFGLVMFYRHFRQIPNAFSFPATAPARVLAALAMVLVLAFASSWQIRNAVVYSNPLYPISVTVLGVELPGRQIDRVTLSAPHIDNPPLVRWAASVFEYRAYDQRAWPWSDSQGHVSHDAWSFRIGGFYGVYVMLLLLFLGYLLCYYTQPAYRWKILGFMGLFTLFFMFLPASYYLRYNIWWMLLLVGVTLIVAGPAFKGAVGQRTEVLALFRGAVIACCLASLLLTGFRYVTPSNFMSVERWVEARGTVSELQGHMGPDDVVCVRQRMAIYYARVFIEGAQHTTVQVSPQHSRRMSDERIREHYGCTYLAK